MFLPSCLRGHSEQYNVVLLLRHTGCDMKLGFLGHSRSREVDWSCFEALQTPYDFDAGLMSLVKASIEQGRKLQNDDVALADRKLPDVLVVFIEGASMSQKEAKSQVHQFLAA